MIHIYSFGYKHGNPFTDGLSWKIGDGCDDVFTNVYDCRSLRNPHHERDLKDLNGKDHAAVRSYVFGTHAAYDMLDLGWQRAIESTSDHDLQIVAFGCTGGQHRSVTLAETLAALCTAAYIPHKLDHLHLRKANS